MRHVPGKPQTYEGIPLILVYLYLFAEMKPTDPLTYFWKKNNNSPFHDKF